MTDPKFGAAGPIIRRAATLYGFGLELFAERLDLDPGILELVSGPWQRTGFLFDPLVRAALDPAFGDLKAGTLDPRGDLADLLRSLADGAGPDRASGPVLRELSQAGQVRTGRDGGRPLAVWGGEVDPRTDEWFTSLAEDQLAAPGATVRLVKAGADAFDALQSGIEICENAVPGLVANALEHVAVIALVDGENVFQSGSVRTVPGTIFLRADTLRDPLTVAEGLLHEATHHKLYDLYTTYSILPPGYDMATAPVVVAEWNPAVSASDTNRWPADRALAAFHVYTHLTVLFGALADSGLAAERAALAHYRAGYLGEALGDHGSAALGPDGLAMRRWLCDVLATGAPAPAAHPAGPAG